MEWEGKPRFPFAISATAAGTVWRELLTLLRP
jgi:hypothetical protein